MTQLSERVLVVHMTAGRGDQVSMGDDVKAFLCGAPNVRGIDIPRALCGGCSIGWMTMSQF
jgi:hypothetical protein